MRILTFGDSITYGAWDTEAGWVERVKKYAHNKTVNTNGATKMQVINLGIGGDTSTKILARMEAEIQARYSPNWPFVFVFCFGTNDERTLDSTPETSLDQFTNNVREIIAIAQKYTQHILFLGCPPIAKELIKFNDHEYSDTKINEYDKALMEVVRTMNVKYVSLREEFDANSSEELFSYDSLHPNDNGHELIAQQVIKFLQTI